MVVSTAGLDRRKECQLYVSVLFLIYDTYSNTVSLINAIQGKSYAMEVFCGNDMFYNGSCPANTVTICPALPGLCLSSWCIHYILIYTTLKIQELLCKYRNGENVSQDLTEE